MPLSNAERQRRYVEKQKLYNKEEFDKKISLKMKKYYKKVKNEDLSITTSDDTTMDNNDNISINNSTDNDESIQSIEYIEINNEDTDNEEKNKDFECILLKPLKKRINPLNKSKLNDKSVQIYLKTIKKIYKNYYKKDLENDTDLMNVLTNKSYNLPKLTSQLQFLKTDLFNVIKNNYKDITILYAVITRIKNFAKQVKELYPYIEQKQNTANE